MSFLHLIYIISVEKDFLNQEGDSVVQALLQAVRILELNLPGCM